MRIIARCLLCSLPLLFSVPALSQIDQDRPELCGSQSRAVPVPKGISARVLHDQNQSVLVSIASSASPQPVGLPWLGVTRIEEACPLGPRKIVLFATPWVSIVDLGDGTVLDSFIAYDPIMSPDQHWIVMRRFFPPQTEFVPGDEYVLYDLTADAKTNRRGQSEDIGTLGTPGWAIYPVLAGNLQIQPGDVPDADIHQFRSASFFWDPTSHYVAFADEQHKALSIVLSRLDGDKITTWTHPIPASDFCAPASGWALESATVAVTSPSSPIVVTQFHSNQAGCVQKPFTLSQADFIAAPLESYPVTEGRPSFELPYPPAPRK